jgi:hypothetical protein
MEARMRVTGGAVTIRGKWCQQDLCMLYDVRPTLLLMRASFGV